MKPWKYRNTFMINVAALFRVDREINTNNKSVHIPGGDGAGDWHISEIGNTNIYKSLLWAALFSP